MIPFLEKLLNGQKVEWKTLGEVGTFYNGLTGKTKNDFVDGNVFYIPYKNIFDNLSVNFNKLEKVKIIENEHQHQVKYGDVLFTASSETPDEAGMSSVVTKKFNDIVYLNSFCFGLSFNNDIQILPDYSKYLFRSHYIRSEISKVVSGVTRFNISKERFKRISIPLPPLSVQAEIVRILDKFTELTTELTTELLLRKKQYTYYRDKLLNFEGRKDVQWKTLGEVFDTKNGYTPSKSNKEYWDNGNIPWFRMEDIRSNGGILSDSIQHITSKGVKGSGLFEANSIIMATTATIGEHALLIADSLANQQFTNFSIRKSLKDKILPQFAYYYFFIIDEWCKNNTNISSFPSVDMGKLKKQKFPLPPLSVQAEIVEILDKFDTLTTSISEGLPKEIALRKKQYEYYREQLLDFPKNE